jgi:RHS repeat-associated protein
VVVDSIAGDPRFGIVAPIPAGRTVRLPSGTAQVIQVSRPYSALTFNPPAVASGPWVEQVVRNGIDTVRTEFDLASRRLTIARSAERRTTVTVDSAGRPLAIHVPGLDTLRRAYDSRGRLTEIRQGSRRWQMSYDASGRLEELRDPLDRTTTFAYDAADRETLRVLPGGRRVAFRYDEAGNLERLIPPGAASHEFDYTPVDLTSRYRPPGAGMADSLTQYEFNLDRQLETLERPDGLDVALTYNATSGRLEEISTPRGEAAFDYDGVGRLTSLGAPDGVELAYGYDGPIPTSESWSGPVTGSVAVELDNAFRVASQQVGSSPTVSYLYQDPDGLPTQAGALSLTRDPGHGLLTGTALGTITTSAGYSGYGELEHAVARAGGDTLWRAVYGRDALGRIVSIAERVLGTTTLREYAYSDSGFLTVEKLNGVEMGRYGYDGNGNRVRLEDSTGLVTASYDAQDRLTAYGATSYAYNAGGDLESRISGADTTSYTYDAFGNLVEVRLASGDTIRYLMDGRNRRVARLRNGVVTQRWLYQDQLEPVAEVDSAGGVLARYVYGTRAHVPDYVVKGDTTYRIIADHLGSVRLVVNATTGAVAQRLEYDAWGNVLEDTNPGFQSFGYAGGLWDGATGLVRFGARDYDPSVGRWTAKDPVGLSGGANAYEYCDGRPVERVDPSGLAPGNELTEPAGADPKRMLACLQAILDAAGYIDPTGVADALNATLYAVNGEWGYAAISAAGILPFGIGDAAKLKKLLAAGVEPTARQLAKVQRQLAEHGAASVGRSQRSLGRRLDEHLEKLDEVRRAGGRTSSLEKEIVNFAGELEAIRRVLGGN